MIENIEEEITHLVREMALQNTKPENEKSVPNEETKNSSLD